MTGREFPKQTEKGSSRPTGAARRTPGWLSLGLGLHISRFLARRMGGDVTYRYDGKSIFELTLPLAADK